MDPHLGRTAFNMAVLLIILSLIPLPFLKRDSAEFIVDVIAFVVSLLFLLLISWDVRRQVKREKTSQNGSVASNDASRS